jgi:ATP-dependent helicase/nuclease subunit A
LDEMLNMAINYDREFPDKGIQGFISQMLRNKSDIKRELESGQNQVRIMTVHASKGLQAPIVICPDTTTVPGFTLRPENGFVWSVQGVPLWPVSKDGHCEIIEQIKEREKQKIYEEYCRLLYVAMTRAEDHLIVCGVLNKKQKDIDEKSWYTLVQEGLQKLGAKEIEANNHLQDLLLESFNQGLFYKTGNMSVEEDAREYNAEQELISIPAWAIYGGVTQSENKQQKTVSPSRLMEEDTAFSPLHRIDDTYKFRRGNLTHTLLQFLSSIGIHNRYETGANYLNKNANDLPETIRNEILDEVIGILSHEKFAPYFGEGSRAEVPVSGVIDGQSISGQIDRLLVTETDVWIVDFKSNRPPPTDVKDVPDIYRKQLQVYKQLMSEISPHHIIHCALLWTDGPHMMILDDI